ncbi:AAA family ATPase [Alienimonas californiensis]|uniref:ATPase family associated with various cellular activities (AAA) n=1 Tax=Alienimonas californiensis TaxID=2527989 RepID=A0A517PEC7_9PLAN|nr:AAA family ATPase [Alienimonas californiensis]QDT17734.1 ATPase family associated with various cellular activities (AAA) [Alienimonas californiensis]
MSDAAPASALLTPEEVESARAGLLRLRDGLAGVIFGQETLLDLVTVGLVARGHLLLEGLPGLGKTELVKALAALLGLEHRRVQFTPDLLPGDIVGSAILQENEDGRGRRLEFRPGPVFTNLLLADEINRATPKTQSALLEAMQERRVTAAGETRPLPDPFFVLATQNPIELEGTYPLPEAQLDRFLFKIDVGGVGPEVLERIVTARSAQRSPEPTQVLDAGELNSLFAAADRVHLPSAVLAYLSRVVAATHPRDSRAPEPVRTHARFGASPRAALGLAAAARAAALLAGKPNVGFDEVRSVAPAVLGHRILPDYAARLDGWDGPKLAAAVLEQVSEVDKGSLR